MTNFTAMNNKLILSAAITLITSSCHVNKAHTTSRPAATATEATDSVVAGTPLPALMQIPDTIKAGEAVLLTFTVFNNTGLAQKFCKWHTPFEPLMSKYLEIQNEAGQSMPYQGPMAKRVMPPPASSYLSVASKSSVSASVDLVKAYAVNAPGKYTITYTGQYMSGIVVKESVSFIYLK